jgi:hypothetical protein
MWRGALNAGRSMLLRMFLVLVVLAGFAVSFSELVVRSDDLGRAERAASNCQDWNGPDCGLLRVR